MIKFENISKGKWATDKRAALRVVGEDGITIASTGAGQSGDNREVQIVNAKLIAFAGNLAQKYNIEAIEDLIESSKTILEYHLCEQEGIGSGQPTPKQWLEAVDKLSEALKSIEK